LCFFYATVEVTGDEFYRVSTLLVYLYAAEESTVCPSVPSRDLNNCYITTTNTALSIRSTQIWYTMWFNSNCDGYLY
jgi:hypothetical protein